MPTSCQVKCKWTNITVNNLPRIRSFVRRDLLTSSPKDFSFSTNPRSGSLWKALLNAAHLTSACYCSGTALTRRRIWLRGTILQKAESEVAGASVGVRLTEWKPIFPWDFPLRTRGSSGGNRWPDSRSLTKQKAKFTRTDFATRRLAGR